MRAVPLIISFILVAPIANIRAADSRSAQMPKSADGIADWADFWSRGQAQGSGPVTFESLPMHAEDIQSFVPYGMTAGGHVCPIDHCYFYPKPVPEGRPHFDVLAPADGFIVVIGHRTQLIGSTEREREYDDYAMTIEHSDSVYSQYDLLTSLAPEVLGQLDAGVRAQITGKTMVPPVHVRIPVKAGQVIGKVGGRSLDFGVVNTRTRLAGFLTLELYGNYSWRVHLADPFDYFVEPLKKQLAKLNARKVPPFGGRIDYDIDGRLIGNWFLEGSGGYVGNRNDPRGYWMGHLAFAYHHIDPTKIIVSIGDFGGQPKTFWVKGNAPDPAKIGEKDGVVKYDLVYASIGGAGQAFEGIPAGVQGAVLAQVLPGRKLKFEAFPANAASAANGFTAAAKIYER